MKHLQAAILHFLKESPQLVRDSTEFTHSFMYWTVSQIIILSIWREWCTSMLTTAFESSEITQIAQWWITTLLKLKSITDSSHIYCWRPGFLQYLHANIAKFVPQAWIFKLLKLHLMTKVAYKGLLAVSMFDCVLRSTCARVRCLLSDSNISKKWQMSHLDWPCSIEKESVL